MTRRTNGLSAELSPFVRQYRRKAQRGVEPNDRGYSREAEELMNRLSPEELSALLSAESNALLPSRRRKKQPVDLMPKKKGRGP